MVKTTQKQPHTPLRTCIATREKLPKKELSRFVYVADEKKVVFDPKGKARGRGANLQKALEYFDIAVKSGAFNRALKIKVSQENLDQLREEFSKYLEREKLKKNGDKVTVRINTGQKVKLD